MKNLNLIKYHKIYKLSFFKTKMVEEEKTGESESNSEILEKLRKNPWMVSTVVLGIVALVLLFFTLKPGLTGNVIAGGDAGSKLVDFLNAQVGGGVDYVSSQDLGNIYGVDVSYQNQTIPVYITKDGKYYVSGATLIASANQTQAEETPSEVPKSDKPIVDLYVFSYCPYGLQTEKGFIPVYNLLKNKATLDIKFIGAMHGQFEETESLRQLCIKKNYGEDKFMSYISSFADNTAIGNCNGDDTCLKPLIEGIMNQMGIDANKINTCMTSDAPSLYSADEAQAQGLGVTGSPTLVINGVETQSGRSPAALLSTICSAFNTAPAECSQTLSSTTPSAGFGGSSSSSSSSSATC